MEEIRIKYCRIKKMVDIMKKIMSFSLALVIGVLLVAFCAPCLLVFSMGSDGEPSVWNLVGLVWCVVVYLVFRYIMKQ